MSPNTTPESPILDALSDWRARAILALLRDRTPPVAEERVATYLAVQARGESPETVTSEERDQFLVELRHTLLPRLEAYGLVTREESEDSVRPTDHPVFDDSAFNRILNLDEEGLDDVLAAVSRRRRRLVVRLVRESPRPMSLTQIAEEIHRYEADAGDPDPTEVNDLIAALYHNHLPKLDDAGIVDYDTDAGAVSYAEHPALEVVFGVLSESEPGITERFDGFFEGLEVTARKASDRIGMESDLPESWNSSHHG